MLTRAHCLAGVCPCSQPEYPGDDHQCPPDTRTYAEIEADDDRQRNRPFEEDEGVRVEWP